MANTTNDTPARRRSKRGTDTDLTRAEVQFGSALRAAAANDAVERDPHVKRARKVQRDLDFFVRALRDPARIARLWNTTEADVENYARAEIDRLWKRSTGHEPQKAWRFALMKYIDARASGKADVLVVDVDHFDELDAKQLDRIIAAWPDKRSGAKTGGARSKWKLLSDVGATVFPRVRASTWKRDWERR